MNNPIIDEIHQIREQMLEEYGGDLDALVKDIQRRTEERARAGHPVMPPPREEVPSSIERARKAG